MLLRAASAATPVRESGFPLIVHQHIRNARDKQSTSFAFRLPIREHVFVIGHLRPVALDLASPHEHLFRLRGSSPFRSPEGTTIYQPRVERVTERSPWVTRTTVHFLFSDLVL